MIMDHDKIPVNIFYIFGFWSTIPFSSLKHSWIFSLYSDPVEHFVHTLYFKLKYGFIEGHAIQEFPSQNGEVSGQSTVFALFLMFCWYSLSH